MLIGVMREWTRQRRRGPFDSSAINLTFSSYTTVLSAHTYSLLNMCLDTICKHAFTYRHTKTNIFIRNNFRFQQENEFFLILLCFFAQYNVESETVRHLHLSASPSGWRCAFAP